jgi:hypothetical protein
VKKIFSVCVVLSVVPLFLTACGNSPSSGQKSNSPSSGQKSNSPSSGQKSNNSAQSWIDDWDTQSSDEAKQAFIQFKKSQDDFTGQSELKLPDSKSSPLVYGKTNFDWILFSAVPNEEYFPLLSVNYVGENWEFYTSLKVKIGKDVRELEQLGSPSRDVTSGSVTENLQFRFNPQDINFFSQIFTSGKPVFRLYGDTHVYTDFELTTIQLSNLKTVLLGYKYLVHQKIQPPPVIPTESTWG